MNFKIHPMKLSFTVKNYNTPSIVRAALNYMDIRAKGRSIRSSLFADLFFIKVH